MRLTIVMFVVVVAGLGQAAEQPDQPLRVYAFGAAGAAVYVAPLTAAAPPDSTSEIGERAFSAKFRRGTVPLETTVKPGQYLVSVVLTTEKNMREASLDARQFVWDGYDFHALVGQRNTSWRYAQCYLVEKKLNWPLEVLAVFTDQMPMDEALSYDCGEQATRYTGEDEDVRETLDAERIPMTFHDDIIQGLRAGHKVLLRRGENRYALQADGPVNLRLTRGRGQGAWAGHALSIVDCE